MTPNLVKKITNKSAWTLFFLAAASAVLDWKRFPPAILLGGIVGILHLKGVVATAGTLTKGIKTKGVLWLFSIFRLMAVAAGLFLLVRDVGIDPLGLLAGLIIVHAFILLEGWLNARKS